MDIMGRESPKLCISDFHLAMDVCIALAFVHTRGGI